jgi:hypothetical protein
VAPAVLSRTRKIKRVPPGGLAGGHIHRLWDTSMSGRLVSRKNSPIPRMVSTRPRGLGDVGVPRGRMEVHHKMFELPARRPNILASSCHKGMPQESRGESFCDLRDRRCGLPKGQLDVEAFTRRASTVQPARQPTKSQEHFQN